MTLYRIFSVGGLSCLGSSPIVATAGYPGEGYVLVIRKNSTRKLCLGCVRNIVENGGCRVTEDEKYLTISNP